MGNSCTKAHSAEELQEWIQRVKVAVKKKKQALKEGLLSYQDRLIAEYRTCSNEVLIVSHGRQGGNALLWRMARSLLCKSLGTEPAAHLPNGDAERGVASSFLHPFRDGNPRACSGYPTAPLCRGSLRLPRLLRGDAEQQWVRTEREDLLTVPSREDVA